MRFGLAFFLLLVLATQAAAQDRLDEKYVIGERIGRGVDKHVHEVKDHPDLAIGILHDGRPEEILTDERAALRRLARKGIPAAEILAIGTYDGAPAYLLRRYVLGTKDRDWLDRMFEVLNEKTIASVDAILRSLRAARWDLEDAQFLVDREGSLVVGDPKKIKTGVDEPKEAASVLETVRGQARRAIVNRARSALARLGLDDPGLAVDLIFPGPLHACASVLERAAMAIARRISSRGKARAPPVEAESTDLLEALVRARGGSVGKEERARLDELARQIVSRRRVSRTPGLSGLLGERVTGERDRDRER